MQGSGGGRPASDCRRDSAFLGIGGKASRQLSWLVRRKGHVGIFYNYSYGLTKAHKLIIMSGEKLKA